MADIVLVLVALGFFALCALYVVGCDRMIRRAEGPEPTTQPVADTVVG